MNYLTITKKQAAQFVLRKQGLIGSYRFAGKDGAYSYVRQAGCIQYDPVDVCGKNAELTLQSRVKGLWWEDGIRHTKKMDKALERTLRTFAKFNDCNDIEMCIEG